jgi:hypothetical protein
VTCSTAAGLGARAGGVGEQQSQSTHIGRAGQVVFAQESTPIFPSCCLCMTPAGINPWKSGVDAIHARPVRRSVQTDCCESVPLRPAVSG